MVDALSSSVTRRFLVIYLSIPCFLLDPALAELCVRQRSRQSLRRNRGFRIPAGTADQGLDRIFPRFSPLAKRRKSIFALLRLGSAPYVSAVRALVRPQALGARGLLVNFHSLDVLFLRMNINIFMLLVLHSTQANYSALLRLPARNLARKSAASRSTQGSGSVFLIFLRKHSRIWFNAVILVVRTGFAISVRKNSPPVQAGF